MGNLFQISQARILAVLEPPTFDCVKKKLPSSLPLLIKSRQLWSGADEDYLTQYGGHDAPEVQEKLE